MDKHEKHFSSNWKPGEDFFVRLSDETGENRDEQEMKWLVAELRVEAGSHDFDLKQFGGWKGLKKTVIGEHKIQLMCVTCFYRDIGGFCRSEKFADDEGQDSDKAKDMLLYSCSEGCGFKVGDNFGCIHHKDKPEE